MLRNQYASNTCYLYWCVYACSDADIEAKDNDHYTPLLTAAEFGQKEAFECLMSNLKEDGAKMIAVQNKDKKITLFLAAESNHPDLVKVSWYDIYLSCIDPFINF